MKISIDDEFFRMGAPYTKEAEDIIKTIKNKDNNLDKIRRTLSTLLILCNKEQNLRLNIKNGNPSRLLKKFKLSEAGNFKIDVLREALDHSYLEKFDDYEVLVGEPYHMGMGQLKRLIEFCEKNNLNFFINGKSNHFPNNTIKIVFSNNNLNIERFEYLKTKIQK